MTGSAPPPDGVGGGGAPPPTEDDGNGDVASSSPSSSPLSTAAAAAAPEPRRPLPLSENGTTTKYRALVLDAGPIIKRTGYDRMRNAARSYYTVPGVVDEIRDAKSREHFDALPFEVIVRAPSKEGCKAICDFARLTGDYRSLSSVDVQVLGLLYDLEVEGCGGNVDHVRKTPKRTLGVGKIESLGGEDDGKGDASDRRPVAVSASSSGPAAEGPSAPSDGNGGARSSVAATGARRPATPSATKAATWASLVNPDAASSSSSLPRAEPPAAAVDVGGGDAATAAEGGENEPPDRAFDATTSSDGPPPVDSGVGTRKVSFVAEELGGQFSDAEEDEENDGGAEGGIVAGGRFRYDNDDDSDDDGEEYADPDREIGDEECDVYVLDPEEAEERRRSGSAKAEQKEEASKTSVGANGPRDGWAEEELQSDFPSLAAASNVPYEDSDDEDDDRVGDGEERVTAAVKAKERQAKLSSKSLEPATTRTGKKSYDSFRKYRDVVKPKGLKSRPGRAVAPEEEPKDIKDRMPNVVTAAKDEANNEDRRPSDDADRSSRIVGGTTLSGQGGTVDDDGEGWIASVEDLRERKAFGTLDPSARESSDANKKKNDNSDGNARGGAAHAGPPLDQRAACATTDFAMQNVVLQMNLRLFSIDGRRVRRLKTWVTRCGACYAVYAGGDGDDKKAGKTNRLFCDRCGSDALQRVAASLDKETGRLRLHLKKNYKHNLRGTKYNLPKPGKGNRFEGDLLLREDQLLVGAWNQKVKRRSGKGEAASLFGSDVASNVGCHAADLTKRDDIKVGFGRRNPNATKHGRERRGKKKRGTENKACGLRRY